MEYLLDLYIPALVSYKALIPIGYMLTLSLLLKGFYFFYDCFMSDEDIDTISKYITTTSLCVASTESGRLYRH